MNAVTEPNRQIAKSPARRIEAVYPLRLKRGRPTPFPTIYWLRDPALDRAVADLERRGLIADIEKRLLDDEALRTELHADHARYRDQRWAVLSDADRAVVEASESLQRSFRGGVGGVADFDHVKCLHAHVAHAIADKNTIGKLVLSMFDV